MSATRSSAAISARVHDCARDTRARKSSVSLWVRDVEFVPQPRNRGHRSQRVHPLALAKRHEIERLRPQGLETIGRLSDREVLIAGVALYAGEGAKRDGSLAFANSDPRMIAFFVMWLRRFFTVEESRLRLRLYSHEGLDLDAANRFWSELTGIPVVQFRKPYRAVADASIRHSKHVMGCPAVTYHSSATHRRVMGLVSALLSSGCLPG